MQRSRLSPRLDCNSYNGITIRNDAESVTHLTGTHAARSKTGRAGALGSPRRVRVEHPHGCVAFALLRRRAAHPSLHPASPGQRALLPGHQQEHQVSQGYCGAAGARGTTDKILTAHATSHVKFFDGAQRGNGG